MIWIAMLVYGLVVVALIGGGLVLLLRVDDERDGR